MSSDFAPFGRWRRSFCQVKPLVAVVQYELFLAIWLLSGLFPGTAWWITIGTFGLFAVVSGGKALAGDPTCGCFGRVPTSPWLSLSINMAAILGLVGEKLMATKSTTPAGNTRGRDGSNAANQWLGTAWLVTAVALLVVTVDKRAAADLPGIGTRVGDFVLVEPERMVGHCPEPGTQITLEYELVQATRNSENKIMLLDQIRAEGPPSWDQMERNLQSAQVHYEIVERDRTAGETTQQRKRVEAQLSQGQFLIQETFLPERFSEVHCRNDDYEFSLAGTPGEWSVRSNRKGRDSEGQIESTCEYLVGILRLPWSISAVPLAILVRHESFQVDAIKRLTEEELALDFRVVRDTDELQGLSHGRIVLAPTRRWAICRYRVHYRDGLVANAELTYDRTGPPWISQLDLVVARPPHAESSFHLEHCRYEPGPVETQQFRLSAFGLPEYEDRHPSGGRRWILLISLGAALGLLSRFIGRRSFRSSAS